MKKCELCNEKSKDCGGCLVIAQREEWMYYDDFKLHLANDTDSTLCNRKIGTGECYKGNPDAWNLWYPAEVNLEHVKENEPEHWCSKCLGKAVRMLSNQRSKYENSNYR